MSDITVTEAPVAAPNKAVAFVKKFTPTKSQLKAAGVGARHHPHRCCCRPRLGPEATGRR